MNHNAAPAGPYAIGTFRAGGREFAGPLVGDRVRPLDLVAGLERPTVRESIEHWITAQPELSALAAPPSDMQVTLRLNGRVRQDESTRDMIVDVARIVSYCSQIATLLPGDLVLTGNLAGNGPHRGRLLRPGDVMEGEITGLGRQRNGYVAEDAR